LTISQSKADELLQDDISKFEVGVSQATTGVPVNQNQYDALVIFAFNVGLGALRSSTLLKKVKENPKDNTIANEFLKWKFAGGVVSQGLINRRNAESQLYFT
jgi:lysozyme